MRPRPPPPQLSGPPGSPRPSRRARSPRALPLGAGPSVRPPGWGRAGGEASADWCAGGPAPPAAHAPSRQLGADAPEAVAQGTRRRLGPPTALWPRTERLGPGDAPPGTQRLRWPCSDAGGKGPSPHLGLLTQRLVSPSRTWHLDRGEARRCCPHVTASGKMAL
ncbi:translation initiation factor IF-2-like, partial [Daubentonia madagascariensis]